MDQPPLLEVMSREVASQCEAILAEARREAETLQQSAREQSARQREDALQEAKADIEGLAHRARERAEAEAHMTLLTTKDTVADEIIEFVRAEIQRVAAGEEFPPILDALLGELIAGAPQDVVVMAPAAHVDQCRAKLEALGKADVPVEALPGLRDGVAIQDKVRSYRTTNTLSTRLVRLEDDLRKLCIERLFPRALAGGGNGSGA